MILSVNANVEITPGARSHTVAHQPRKWKGEAPGAPGVNVSRRVTRMVTTGSPEVVRRVMNHFMAVSQIVDNEVGFQEEVKSLEGDMETIIDAIGNDDGELAAALSRLATGH